MQNLIVELVRGRVGDDCALEVALAQALLQGVARRERAPIMRSYRPRPTVAFGRQDALLAGFASAAAAARAHGFEPVIRAPGGHAAAYHEGCIVLDEIMPSRDSISGMQERFAAEAERHAQALLGLGVAARIGAVPGEYCPGQFTVNARGEVKLIGTAQRLVGGAWLFSTVVVVQAEAPLRAVLADVYGALGLAWDPRTVGSVATEAPGVSADDVERALICCYATRYRFVHATIGAQEITAAQTLIGRHRIAGSDRA